MFDFSSLHAFWLEELLQGIPEKFLPSHADVEVIFSSNGFSITGRR
jgi:hypothetical protein